MDKCKYCNLIYTSKENLKEHLNSAHQDVCYKDRHKYFQSLFTFTKSTKAARKLAKGKFGVKFNGRSKYKFKFDKKYRGEMIQERSKCENCNITYDLTWIFKNTNIAPVVRICKKCEHGINKHDQKKGYIKIIYTSFESKR
ncbi:MAG TPA: hypothetical protein DCP78_19755 [Sphingobacterium sp.]|nr:hypothetical protein [Sphingobacterium sp.]HAL54384.1 hypothetical protein [Sphingobacterium sp.]